MRGNLLMLAPSLLICMTSWHLVRARAVGLQETERPPVSDNGVLIAVWPKEAGQLR